MTYFDCFTPFSNVCIFYIPHKYSKEQSKKSVKVLIATHSVCIEMQSCRLCKTFRPNVVGISQVAEIDLICTFIIFTGSFVSDIQR